MVSAATAASGHFMGRGTTSINIPLCLKPLAKNTGDTKWNRAGPWAQGASGLFGTLNTYTDKSHVIICCASIAMPSHAIICSLVVCTWCYAEWWRNKQSSSERWRRILGGGDHEMHPEGWKRRELAKEKRKFVLDKGRIWAKSRRTALYRELQKVPPFRWKIGRPGGGKFLEVTLWSGDSVHCLKFLWEWPVRSGLEEIALGAMMMPGIMQKCPRKLVQSPLHLLLSEGPHP